MDKQSSITSTEPLFLELDKTLKANPCEEWLFAYEYNFYLVIISGAMIGILNAICVAFFE